MLVVESVQKATCYFDSLEFLCLIFLTLCPLYDTIPGTWAVFALL